jgi:hypothetical protein
VLNDFALSINKKIKKDGFVIGHDQLNKVAGGEQGVGIAHD